VVGVRLADDRRGRVPFALLGVLVLVGSATFSTALSSRGPADERRAVDRAVERVEANANAALRAAVAEAGRRAAREPVTRPADTPFGSVLDPDRPFRDALRIRIYLSARERLRAVRYGHDGVVAAASLPPTPTPAALAAAKRRVTVERADDGAALRVVVRGLRIEASRDGRTVVASNRTVETVVSTPALALHDRAVRFEERLNRGPLEGPGLGRRLTGRLYPLVWARAYAQRGGLPVENVLANRHVAVATNGAVLAEQRAAFGRSDPAGRRGLDRALVRTGVEDLAGPAGVDASPLHEHVLARPNEPADREASIPRFDTGDAPGPDHRLTVRVGRSADVALAATLAGSGNRSVAGAARAGYRVTGRLRLRTDRVAGEPRPDPGRPPEPGYDLEEASVSTTATVENASVAAPAAGAGERRVASFGRRVRLDHEVTWTWVDGNETERTTGEWSERYRVGVAVTVEPDRRSPGPNRSVEPAFEPGGRFDGPNLVDTPAAVRAALVEDQGGRDGVATAAARDRLDRTRTRVVGDRPPGLDPWLRTELSALRDAVRNESVRVRGVRLAAGAVVPPARLADRLRERRAALLDAPARDGRYRGAPERAVVAARAVYLDRVVASLERRAERARARNDRLDDRLAGPGGVAGDRVLSALEAARRTTTPERRATIRGRTGAVRIGPDGSPAYLTRAAVGSDLATAVASDEEYHPLAARNRNLFAVPYGDAADHVTNDSGGTTLRTAARTLVSAAGTTGTAGRDDTAERRERLRAATRDSYQAVERRMGRTVARRTTLDVGAGLAAVRAAARRWEGPGRRALAAANGSLARAAAAETVDRLGDPPPGLETRLRTHLRRASGTARRSGAASVPEDAVGPVHEAVRTAAERRRTTVQGADTTGGGDGAGSRAAARRTPAGLPVAPAPGYWYATVNAWTVSVRGAYARFALHTRRGPPGETLRYVRDGSTVALDADDDGETERLGHDERVGFAANTTVVVAVPAPGFVGDRGGDADERSAGWPRPACLGPPAGCPRVEGPNRTETEPTPAARVE
jgi:hypothetical protein